MNPYKLEGIMRHIRSQGPLPKDQWDDVLTGDDLLVWFGLEEKLSLDEQDMVKEELEKLAEAEAFMDRLHLAIKR